MDDDKADLEKKVMEALSRNLTSELTGCLQKRSGLMLSRSCLETPSSVGAEIDHEVVYH